MSVNVKFKIGIKKNINTIFNVENKEPIKTIFRINAGTAAFSSILGSPYDNTALAVALDLKADKTAVAEQIETVTDLINSTSTTLDNKIDTVQSDLSGDISTLSETVAANFNTLLGNIQNEATTRAENDTLLQGDINTLQTNLTSEISERTAADNILQGNIATLNETVSNNYSDLNGKITLINGEISDLSDTVGDNYTALSGQISDLSGTVESYNTSTNGRIDTLSQTVSTNDTAINNKVDGINTTLTNSLNSLSNTVSSNYTTLDTKIDNIKSTIDSDISDLSDTVNQNYTDLSDAITNTASTINSRINSEVQTLNTAITTENTQRQAADINLQSQIDAITSASDVFDIVGTYAELEAYDISTVPPNDIIKVLVDSTHNNAATYYRCVENAGIKTWVYVGAEGAYYTKGEADNKFVEKTTTINNKPLSNNITLTASDVNALPADTVIGAGVITLQKNGVDVDSFNVNTTANKSINISVPTDTSDLTNTAGYITASVLNGYATENWVTSQGYLTSISSSDIVSTLGYTPYSASNPAGFITSADLPTNYVTTDTAQTITARKTFTGEKAIYFKQSATSDKLGFTLYNPSDTELAAFEYRPNTINGNALLNINTSYSNACYVGFRYWGTAVNIIAPKVTTAGNYFIPTHITNGNTTVTASNTGTVNISTLLPDVSGFATQTWVQNQNYVDTATLTTTLADYVTNSTLTTTLADYALLSDIPTVPTTDQSYDSTSNNPQSGTAVAEAIASVTIPIATSNTVGTVKPDNSTTRVDANGTLSAISRNVGEIVQSTLPLTDAGLHLLDGTLISGSGIYAEFVDYIAGLVSTYPDLFITEADWQTAVTTYGSCGKFVYNSTNNTVRLPKVSDILQGTTDLSALGDLVEAGLPNITGNMEGYGQRSFAAVSVSGAFTAMARQTPIPVVGETVSGLDSINNIGLNASQSNSIYGNSSTVQPQTIKVLLYIVIAASSKTDIQVDIDNIATDLNGKADTDLSNLSTTGQAILDNKANISLSNVTNAGNIKIANASMPSSRRIQLTTGASGAAYIAPADGYLYATCDTAQYGWIIATNDSFNSYETATVGAIGGACEWVPIRKGSTGYVHYYNASNVKVWFIYAVGSESEAS